ncbi:aldo/keto reductase [Herbiconiux daphne]|uniref:Aldo/keto reductase n=1 Tax=Herbiconiux daphne TaxID=2970914 RepID=A0ABT2H450_9MICO|nr:aldo/keto reductase [Herbiconiux daphne]MCS5734708.1 aldo/keto reductase [Herbiconiux daphne]
MTRPLPVRALAGTPITVTELGFGAASLGNLYRETSDAEARAAVDRAWERGIRLFDTAPHYGLGLSERRLGEALAAHPRDDYVLSTKVGCLLVPNEHPTGRDADFVVPDALRRQWDFSRDGILRSLDQSLARLGTDRIDIVYAHDPDQFGERAAWDAAETLTELRDQGVIGARGVGTNDASQLAELFAADAIDVAMLAGRYTLLEQESALAALEAAVAHAKSVVAVAVFNSGLLATDRPAPDARYDYGPVPDELRARAIALAERCEAFGVTLPQAAIAFPLTHPAVVNVTLGMRTAAQVDRNADLYERRVPPEVWAAVTDL